MTENVASMMVNKLRRMKMTAQHIIKVKNLSSSLHLFSVIYMNTF